MLIRITPLFVAAGSLLLHVCSAITSKCMILPRVPNVQHGTYLEGATFRNIWHVSLHDCATECARRRACVSVNYFRFSRLCQLNTETDPNSQMLVNQTGAAFINVDDKMKEVVQKKLCNNGGCQDGRRCGLDKSNDTACTVEECTTDPISGNTLAQVNGSVGYRQQVTCHSNNVTAPGTVLTSTCQEDGTWSVPTNTDLRCSYGRTLSTPPPSSPPPPITTKTTTRKQTQPPPTSSPPSPPQTKSPPPPPTSPPIPPTSPPIPPTSPPTPPTSPAPPTSQPIPPTSPPIPPTSPPIPPTSPPIPPTSPPIPPTSPAPPTSPPIPPTSPPVPPTSPPVPPTSPPVPPTSPPIPPTSPPQPPTSPPPPPTSPPPPPTSPQPPPPPTSPQPPPPPTSPPAPPTSPPAPPTSPQPPPPPTSPQPPPPPTSPQPPQPPTSPQPPQPPTSPQPPQPPTSPPLPPPHTSPQPPVATETPTSMPVTCGADWVELDDHCYRIDTAITDSWDGAQRICSGLSADLTSIDNDDQYMFLEGMIKEAKADPTVAVTDTFWIGGKFANDGLWEWVPTDANLARTITYFRWGDVAAKNGDVGSCLTLKQGTQTVGESAGLFYDAVSCSNGGERRNVICERKLGNTPIVSSTLAPQPPTTRLTTTKTTTTTKLAATTTPYTGNCEQLWDRYRNMCYRVIEQPDLLDWDTASDACVNENADLVAFHDADQYRFVVVELLGLLGGGLSLTSVAQTSGNLSSHDADQYQFVVVELLGLLGGGLSITSVPQPPPEMFWTGGKQYKEWQWHMTYSNDVTTINYFRWRDPNDPENNAYTDSFLSCLVLEKDVASGEWFYTKAPCDGSEQRHAICQKFPVPNDWIDPDASTDNSDS